MQAEARLGTWVRVLTILSAVLLVTVGLAAATVRSARAEVQQLRAEREEVKAGVASTWTRQPVNELREAIRALDAFWAEPIDGFGRAGGLCADGRLNDEALATYAVGVFLSSRAAGRSVQTSLEDMHTAIKRSDAYRAVHPDRAIGK